MARCRLSTRLQQGWQVPVRGHWIELCFVLVVSTTLEDMTPLHITVSGTKQGHTAEHAVPYGNSPQ